MDDMAFEAKRIGAKIIAHYTPRHDNTCRVLAEIHGNVQPFVVYVWTGTIFIWGHYFATLDEARADFARMTVVMDAKLAAEQAARPRIKMGDTFLHATFAELAEGCDLTESDDLLDSAD